MFQAARIATHELRKPRTVTKGEYEYVLGKLPDFSTPEVQPGNDSNENTDGESTESTTG